MTLTEKWIGALLIFVVGMVAFDYVRAQAIITTDLNTAGRWVAESAFYVNSPLGEKFACRLGVWTPEFEPDEISLVCVSWGDDEARYRGHRDGELELIE